MKKFVLLMVVVCLVAPALFAGGAAESKPELDLKGKPYVPVIALGFQHQFWQAVKMGADQAAADYDVVITFEGPEAETMIDKQVDMMKTALGKNPVAIGMAAIDPESVRLDLEAAKARGVKVVGFDSGVGDMADVHCSTDNYVAGGIAGKHAAELLGGKGQIGIISFSQTLIDSKQRVDGFIDAVKQYPDIKIVDVQYGDGDHLKSADIAKGMLVAFPKIDMFYANNEGSIVGAYNGVREVGKIGKILLVGFDSSKALKDAIRDGEIAGAVTQDPVGMGYKTVEAAVKLYKGESVPKVIDTGAYWYDKTNMDEAHIAPLLYD
ncbi:MAG: ABC transporter substrate-binding protein [Sphaerochaetaceae bacterium]|jgi:ribose transport system substrate-binding protein|nr:ABC transporter substrate-binding protein [Sphaerochaetaceae bacterium]MDY0371630.1 ABC transporter substrate-binding protein [Sphaerochaetaceae bacterium]